MRESGVEWKGVPMTQFLGRPGYPLNDLAEQRRYFHHLEWGTINGYEYKTTRVSEAEHPGWVPPAPEGWELNTDRWPQFDEERAGWVHVAPGVLRNPNARGGPELVAHWRRKL